MRNRLLGLAFVVGIGSAWADCTDTTILLKAGTPGFTSGATSGSATYDPAATNGLNALIRGCADATLAVHLNLDLTEYGKTKDTVKLTGPIIIGGRAGKTTALNMNRPSSTGVLDSLFTFVESGTNPTLLIDSSNNPLVLSNMGFARRALNNTAYSMIIQAKGTQVTGCHFWMADKDNPNNLGALVDITSDSVLVERSLFRAPSDGNGRTIAIHTGGAANKVEIRANVFVSTGLYLTASGASHIVANTFVGSRDAFSPIIIGGNIGTNFNNVLIMHNLFAPKADTLSPIVFSTTSTSVASSSILRNAWSQGKANLPLAVGVTSTATTAVSLQGATGQDANIPLPRGFSNYGPKAVDVKDYPLTELRADPTLARKNSDFGKLYRAFFTGSWSGSPTPIGDVSSAASRLYFSSPAFAPFLPGKSWLPNVKVGAFVDQDTVIVPTPLDSGAQGASLKLQRDTSAADKAKITTMVFDPDYYKQIIQPDLALFFFSDSILKLASNDTTALKAAKIPFVRKSWGTMDSILSVPKEVRNGTDIFVKMLHFRGAFRAAVQSNAAIGTLSNVPSYPVNDLILTQNQATTDNLNKVVGLTVKRGSEAIDSVRIVTLSQSFQPLASKSFAAGSAGQTLNLTISVADKGTYYFQAVPVASIGTGVFKSGSATQKVGPINLGITAGDTLYVANKTACPGDGDAGTPFCLLDSALNRIAARKGGTIILLNATPAVALDTITIAKTAADDTLSLTIISGLKAGLIDANRPIIRGTASKEAMVITRPNVTLRGFTLEQPAGSSKPALSLKAGGGVIDANIFRAVAKGSVEAPAINLEVGATAEARIVNNVVWGYAKGVQFSASGSPNIKVLFNTFVADSALNKTPTSALSATGADSVRAVVADNYFSGFDNALETAGAKPSILDHNVYSSGTNLANISEIGGLGPATAVASTDIWTANYSAAIEAALSRAVDCNSLGPCNPLYGGSSANEYNVNVATDFTGKNRKNIKEVGAYEFPPSPSGVLGVVEIKPTLVPGIFRKINFTVTGKSFDPDPNETDSVQVFWSTSDVTHNVDASLSVIPAAQRKSYPIGKLAAGITGEADIDKELTKYWFYAALSRNPAPHTSRVMGFAYSDTLTSNPNLLYENCDFKDSKSACPSDVGVFGVLAEPWKGKFETRVKLTQPTDSGLVKLPAYVSVTDANKYNLDLTSPLPIFSFDAHVPGLGTTNPKQRLIWQVELYFNPDLSGLDLFLLPKDSKGLPTLVPDWNISSIGGGKYRITFESNVDGPQEYAFGKVQAALEPGAVAQTDPEPPVYDFDVARDSSVYPVQVKFKGAAFKTGNPLVLISAIPAGGTVFTAGTKYPGVISDKYPTKTVVATAGYADLEDSLRAMRFYQLYLKAAGADSVSGKGMKRPFPLDSLSFKDFSAATVLLDKDLDLAGGEMTVKVPVGKLFNDYLTYKDLTGKTTRSIEVVFTVFDGSSVVRTRGFIRTRFRHDNIYISEWYQRQQLERSTHDRPHWNLFGYPWDEADTGSLARIVGKKKWDHDHMRLMAYLGTGQGAGAFTEYDGANADAIKYDSGMAVWSGSTDTYTPACGQGMSLDFQPFKMPLVPNRYYDISLPFNFPMKMQDILDSSGLAGATTVSMWHYNDTALRWDPILTPTASPPTKGLALLPWEGYTVKVSAPLTLTFPVADTSRTTAPSAKAAANDGSWAVLVEAANPTAAMDLRIGRGAREMLFPEPPDVPGQNFRLALAKGDEKVSHYIQALDGDWRGHWALRAAAAKGSGGLSLRLREATRQVPVWLADALHGTAVQLSADQPVQVGEEELQANDYHLVAGDRAYVDGLLQSLVPGHLLALSNYPNPFSASTLIRYALPAGFTRTTFDLKVRDFRGRTVWEKTIVAGNALSYLWDGRDRSGVPLPAGVYSLSLTAKAEGKAAYRAVRNLLRM